MTSMHSAPEAPAARTTGDRRKRLARRLAAPMAGLLALGLAAQVLFAGAAVFVDGAWWAVHLAAIHWFDWITVVLVVLGFAGGMSRRFKVLSVVVILLVLAQYVTAGWHGSATLGWGAAVHPLTGFLMFWAVTELLREAWAGRSR